MEFLTQIKAQRQALVECAVSPVIPEPQRQVLSKNNSLLDSAYYATKVAIASGFILLVDWKKPMPLMRREVPLSVLAFGLCGLADLISHKYAMSQTETILVKYTGLRDGIYVSPERFSSMRKMYENKQGRIVVEEEDLIQ